VPLISLAWEWVGGHSGLKHHRKVSERSTFRNDALLEASDGLLRLRYLPKVFGADDGKRTGETGVL
jgi:hypothetical protein